MTDRVTADVQEGDVAAGHELGPELLQGRVLSVQADHIAVPARHQFGFGGGV